MQMYIHIFHINKYIYIYRYDPGPRPPLDGQPQQGPPTNHKDQVC